MAGGEEHTNGSSECSVTIEYTDIPEDAEAPSEERFSTVTNGEAVVLQVKQVVLRVSW